MQATTIRIPPELIERLREAAKSDGRSLNNLITKALTDFSKIGNPEEKFYSHQSHRQFEKTDCDNAITSEDDKKEILKKIKSTMGMST
jgi:predicted DNA-binding protein